MPAHAALWRDQTTWRSAWRGADCAPDLWLPATGLPGRRRGPTDWVPAAAFPANAPRRVNPPARSQRITRTESAGAHPRVDPRPALRASGDGQERERKEESGGAGR